MGCAVEEKAFGPDELSKVGREQFSTLKLGGFINVPVNTNEV